MHGGATPAGLASPHTKHGRYSKHLPTRLAALYEQTEHDLDLMSLRQDIRLIDVFIADNLKRLEVAKDGDPAESAEAWKVMRKTVDGLTDAINAEDYAKVQKSLREMRDVIDARLLYYATEAEVMGKLEQRRKLVETEAKMTLAGEQAISVEKAMLLIGAIAGILKSHIHDPITLAAIQTSIGRLIDAGEATD